MSKKNVLMIFAIIVFLFFMNSISFAGANELSESGLSDALNIHLGEDGLIKLTDKQVDNMAAWRVFIIKYKKFVVGIAGFSAVTMVLLFIKNFLRLGKVADNPQARSEALKGFWVTGIATALLGSVSLITALFYNSLK